ncbi:MAG TPA: beta-ketoacyl synthase N-terminal-like domain-containing protein, partial [Candidatus Angelobacter sp.]|nr:beta-ketoacyl synthase N-terminal-like domain-containing protein [Candidatus Angelobacter sp.]
GEISIKYGIKGISKTFSAERLSAAYAIEYGKLLVDHGRLEVALAGGVESPFSQPVLASMRNLGLLSSDVPAGEAACMIGFGRQTDGCKPRILGFGKAMAPSSALAQSLQNAEITPSQLDLVLLDPPRGLDSFRRRHLAVQLTAIQELKAPAVQVAQPLPFGETVGAAFAVQLAAAVIALEQQQIPVSDFDAGSRDELQTYGFAVNCNQKIDLTNVAVLGSDGYGQWMSCMVANA